ncbi:hypothetical protein Goe7_c02100 [Bacillus phage vB_BveM-Goe7]|nr:hypothetical protein Goe7_c02100 [Bacillus phage vB_BveM-Goe7]
MSFKKLAALVPLELGRECTLSMDAIISVGFGTAALQRNGETVYEESYAEEGVGTVQYAENLAREDPDKDWRIHFIGPFSQEHYQRQGDKRWVLYVRGDGIA